MALCTESSSGLARWQVQKRPLLQDCFGKLWSNGLGRKRLLPVSNANGRPEKADRGVLPERLQRAWRVATFPHPQGAAGFAYILDLLQPVSFSCFEGLSR